MRGVAQPQGRERKADTDAAVRVLKRRGLRASASRRLILEILRDATAPLSAPEIARGPGTEGSIGLDLASVYRNLETLAEHELVQEIHAGRGPGRYVLAGTAAREYLACDDCGRILEIDRAELDEVRTLIRERYGYEVEFTRVPMVGRCGRCLSNSGR
jgi:Fur family ferric uptake transcriptional regulator